MIRIGILNVHLSQEGKTLQSNIPQVRSEAVDSYRTRYYFQCNYPVTSSLTINWSGTYNQFPDPPSSQSGTVYIGIGETESDTFFTAQASGATLTVSSQIVIPSRDLNYIYG